jgi:ABC-type sulfate transport system permease subunit
MEAIAPWQQFGLPGMVIGALFITIWIIGKGIILRLLELQQQERKEWKEAFTTAMGEHNDVLRELTKAVGELRATQCPKL